MPRKAKPGDQIGKYEITKVLNSGGMAISYAAKTPGNEKVFFKQYKSPTTTVSWYKGYVDYQKELKRRIESSPAKNFSYRFVEFFEEEFGGRTYFQVFEFVEGGHDLEAILEMGRSNPKSIAWEQRLTLAKVMMAGVNALHAAGIVHCDLKPPNIQLFTDTSITAGYRLKLIDMDFSILADRRAPWHGVEGYVGSPNYFSPEHLKGGDSVPQLASDVFTCGLILYELLSGAHPYRLDDPAAYAAAVLSHRAPKPALLGKMPGTASDEQVADILYQCLAPAPGDRPTAKDVNLALNGRMTASSPAPRSELIPPPPTAPVPPTREPETVASPTPEPSSKTHAKLGLTAEGGGVLKFGIRTEVGKHLCTPLGEDAKFFASTQFVVDRDAEGDWVVIPNVAATNQTMLNGRAVTSPTKLKRGDVLGVGNEAKRVVKLPLSVSVE
jgi:serine/threonine protein kinase